VKHEGMRMFMVASSLVLINPFLLEKVVDRRGSRRRVKEGQHV
jgi:hypothetical protein